MCHIPGVKQKKKKKKKVTTALARRLVQIIHASLLDLNCWKCKDAGTAHDAHADAAGEILPARCLRSAAGRVKGELAPTTFLASCCFPAERTPPKTTQTAGAMVRTQPSTPQSSGHSARGRRLGELSTCQSFLTIAALALLVAGLSVATLRLLHLADHQAKTQDQQQEQRGAPSEGGVPVKDLQHRLQEREPPVSNGSGVLEERGTRRAA
ncbi:uncharacterized protein LOC144124404 [Amblyomma americanum]